MSFLTNFLPSPNQTPPSASNTTFVFNYDSMPGKSRKLRVTSGQQSDGSDGLGTSLLIKALNNSFTKRMSGSDEMLDTNNLISIIAEFALCNLQHKSALDISARQYCIVQIDESFLINKQIGTLNHGLSSITLSCGDHRSDQQRGEYNIINNIELPSTIRPYCLMLNMNSRQLHFQSQEQAKNRFFINLDTIPVAIDGQSHFQIQSLLNDRTAIRRQINKPIILTVKDNPSPLTIKMYITNFTLPFPFKEQGKEQQKMRQSLYQLLRKSIYESRGYKLHLTKVLDLGLKQQRKFYNIRYATEEQFVRYCQSGDLLLFKDSHTMAKIQRTITNSPVDHVAIVYKSSQVGLSIFQSSSDIGVGLALWRKLIIGHWFEGIDRIVWRKLQVNKKPADFDKKIDEFVKGNLHTKFGLSLPKLLKFKAVTYSKEENKEYFCSELAAELYRYLGLLDSDKSSSQYWPRDFVDGNGIQILNGALDPERQLVFQNPLLKQNYPGFMQQSQ